MNVNKSDFIDACRGRGVSKETALDIWGVLEFSAGKSVKFTIRNADGSREEVRGKAVPGAPNFFTQKNKSGVSLSHVGMGVSVGNFRTARDAALAARDLESILDWSTFTDPDEYHKEVSQDTKNAAVDIIRKHM